MSDLTDRQRQIAELFVSGKTYKQVADECGISSGTVHPTLKTVAKKLGTDSYSRAELKKALDA